MNLLLYNSDGNFRSFIIMAVVQINRNHFSLYLALIPIYQEPGANSRTNNT